MSLIRKHVAVLQAWACLALVFDCIGQQAMSSGGFFQLHAGLGLFSECSHSCYRIL